MMRDVPYAAWFAFIRQHWQHPGLLLDLFSGTGKIARTAAAQGFRAISLDYSFAMLHKGIGLRVQANALELPFATGIASALAATNCSINYLQSLDELKGFFSECRRVLCFEGLIVMDYCPEERAWQLHNRRVGSPGAAVFFHEFDRRQCQLTSRVTVQSDSSHKVTEIHKQRIFSQHEIAESLKSAAFTHLKFTPNYGLPVSGGVSPIMTVAAYAV
jgi:ubiquinone/menaquinone biosynthesis C-methylase UbiE